MILACDDKCAILGTLQFRHLISIRFVKPSPLLFLPMLALPVYATAAGLGEMTVLSRVGEPLQAEVRIMANTEEGIETTCFSLERVKDADLPVIFAARLLLEKTAEGGILRIATSEALAEPLAMLRLKAGCKLELQRDYIVLPLAPESLPITFRASASETDKAPPPRAIVQAQAVPPAPAIASVEQVASARPDPVRQARLADDFSPAPAPQAVPEPPAHRGDRLVLGTSSMQLDYTLPPSMIRETEARLLRMETNLSNLQESLSKLETAVAIGAEIRAAEHELQLAEALTVPTSAGPLTPPPVLPAPEQNPWWKWVELLGGALIGGLLSALLLYRLGRLIPGYQRR